jgi:hypothetical protein
MATSKASANNETRQNQRQTRRRVGCGEGVSTSTEVGKAGLLKMLLLACHFGFWGVYQAPA